MSELGANSLRSNSSSFNSPITFETSGGTENGRLCRAFVNFNGQGAVAIRSQFNVTSITDNDTGYYTVNLTTAMSNTNYAAIASASDTAKLCGVSPARETKTTSSFSVITRSVDGSGDRYDPSQVSASVHA